MAPDLPLMNIANNSEAPNTPISRDEMPTLLQDLRYALRTLIRSPGYAAVALITLALGIGANTAIFSVVNAVILRPLPFPEPDRLVRVYSVNQGDLWTASPPDLVDWRQESEAIAEMGAYYFSGVALGGDEGAELLSAAMVTPGLLPVLGIQPALGRGFDTEDGVPGQDQVAILSYDLWKRRFGGERDINGRSIGLDGEQYTVVGVMPEGFEYPSDRDLWLPLAFDEEDLTTQRGAHYLAVIGRLAPGATLEGAATEMEAIARRLEQEYPESNTAWGATVMGLQESLVGDLRPAFLILLGAVGLVLLIACANVANLFLARALSRERELSIRMALGGSRLRVLRAMLTESVLLGMLGGALGLLLAVWGTTSLTALAPPDIPRIGDVELDRIVLGFTLALSVLTGLIFGLIPALHASYRTDVAAQLKTGGRGLASESAGARSRSGLVVAEMALSVLLVVGAGLLIKSFWQLQRVDPGFDPEGVLAFNLLLPDARYPEPVDVRGFVADLVGEIETLPGVSSAAASFGLPMTGFSYNISLHSIDGRTLTPEEEDRLGIEIRVVTPDYFRTLGIPVIRGRGFSDSDRADAPAVAILNEAAAKLILPGEDPLGHQLLVGSRFGLDRRGGGEIIGIVPTVKDVSLAEDGRPKMYLAYSQVPRDYLSVVLRTPLAPRSFVGPIRTLVSQQDPQLPVFGVREVGELVAESIGPQRFYMTLLALFAATALVLAAVGIYGVIAYSVTRRTGELGLRIALGATPREILGFIMRRGIILAGLGVAVGVAGALAATRLISGLLYGVASTDFATFALTAAFLFAVAMLASYLPARRATGIDPLTAMRTE